MYNQIRQGNKTGEDNKNLTVIEYVYPVCIYTFLIEKSTKDKLAFKSQGK